MSYPLWTGRSLLVNANSDELVTNPFDVETLPAGRYRLVNNRFQGKSGYATHELIISAPRQPFGSVSVADKKQTSCKGLFPACKQFS
jgi:hypothetical protein